MNLETYPQFISLSSHSLSYKWYVPDPSLPHTGIIGSFSHVEDLGQPISARLLLTQWEIGTSNTCFLLKIDIGNIVF